MRATRQFVGGPRDGETVTISDDHAELFLAVVPTEPRFTWNGPVDDRAIRLRHIAYSPAVAPTGEHVLLAPDVAWPDRFDTEAWPRRAAPQLPNPLGGPWAQPQEINFWRRLGPWLWRGDARDPERACPDGNCPGWYEHTVYLLGVPEPHPGRDRHDPPKRFGRVATYVLSHDVEPRELALAAIAGQRTAEDDVIEEVRHQADALRTPWCPEPMCPRRATVRLGGRARSGAGHGDAMCPDHAQQEMQRFDRHYVQSWISTNPVSSFRITNLGT
jgi:hypothetical protein